MGVHFEGGKILVLDDCLYVPDVRRNLVSVFCLSCKGYVGKWCAAEGSVVSGIREGCDHGFQKF